LSALCVAARVTFSWKSRGEKKCALFEKVTPRRKFHDFRYSLYPHAKHEITLICVHPLAHSTRCILSFFTKKYDTFRPFSIVHKTVLLFPRARHTACVHTRFSSKIQYTCISFLDLNTLIFTLFCMPENTLFRRDTFVKKCFVGTVRRRACRVRDIFRKHVFLTRNVHNPVHNVCMHYTCPVYTLYRHTPWHVRMDLVGCIYIH
jgi:hypothetical protein